MTEKRPFDEARIRTVVLVGRRDFGRCPLAARLPVALWPIAGKPAVERGVRHLADEGIREVALCCDDTVSDSVGAIEADYEACDRMGRILGAALLVVHELDSTFWREWELFGLPDSADGLQQFVADH